MKESPPTHEIVTDTTSLCRLKTSDSQSKGFPQQQHDVVSVLVYVITWRQVLLRIICTRVFKIFQNCPRRKATRAIWKILKTQVQLILNSTRSHGITYLSIKGKIYTKENHVRSLFSTNFKITNGCYIYIYITDWKKSHR